MIWTTAKSTEVNSRSTTRPIRSKTSGDCGRAESAHVVTGLAIAVVLSEWEVESLRSDGRRLGRHRIDDGPGAAGGSIARSRSRVRRRECAVEVGDQVVGILETDRAPEQPRCDPGRRQGGVVELAMRRGRGVADDREDAPERCRQLRELEPVDERRAGPTAARELQREPTPGSAAPRAPDTRGP